MKKLIVIAMCVTTLAGTLFASPVDLQLGARPQSMGGAFAALADDVNAAAWNPAGLAAVRGSEMGFMHGQLTDFSGINIDFLSYAQRLEKGGVGFSWLNVGAILKEGEEESKSRMSENTYSLAYAVSPTGKFSLGFALKRLTLDSKVGGGGGIGFDVGSHIVLSRFFTTALVLRNVATDVKDEYFPMNYRVGLAGRFWDGRFNVALDADTKKDINGTEGTTVRMHTGIEFYPAKIFALRAGYDNGSTSAGFGAKAGNWNVDYAWLNNENIGAEHRLSLIYSFEAYKKPTLRKEKKTEMAATDKQIIKKEKAKKDDAKKIEKLYKKSLNYYRKKKYARALAEFQKVAAASGGYKDTDAYILRAGENMKKEAELREAKKAAKKEKSKTGKMPAEEIEKYYKEGQRFYDKSEFDKALESFQIVLDDNPNYKRASNWKASAENGIKKKYYSEAINAYDSGDYKRAKEFFEKILAVDPSHARSKAMVQKCEEKMR